MLSSRDNEDIDPAKVLMGLNFYGNLYKKLGEGGPIIGHEYLDILDRERPPILWQVSPRVTFIRLTFVHHHVM